MSEEQPGPAIPPGGREIGGKVYLPDAKGQLVPLELVKPQDRLMDETVRGLFAKAEELAAAIAAFKVATFADVDAFLQLLLEQYQAKPAGAKGNVSLTTFDGLFKVQIQVADQIRFGPELQVAKAKIDECLSEWSEGSAAELRAVVMNAFRADKEDQINRAALLGLLRLDIQDPRWLLGMQAIRDSMRVEGTKRYVRFYRRATLEDAWKAVSLDVATA